MSAVFTTPITATAFPLSKHTRFQEPHKFSPPRLNFGGNFQKGGSVSWNICGRKQRFMKGCSWVRGSKSGEGVSAFEQEALVEESLAVGNGGLEATLNDLSKWLVTVVFSAIIIWRHDAEALWAVMGSVVNVLLSLVLKQLLNQERPNSTLRSDPGMPSSHAQSITYATTYLVLWLVESYGINTLTTALSGILIALGSYFTWLRVSQNFHTVSQVIVGAIIGLIFSILWFWSWNAFVVQLFVSYLWVRIVVILGAVGFILGFMRHTYYSWILEK